MNNLARVWAVRAGATQKDTIGRLAAASEAGQLDPAVATELTEAFHFLWDVRLHHQADQVQAGEPPDDFIDPASFGSFMRSGLKTAFRVIARAQRLLGSEEAASLERRARHALSRSRGRCPWRGSHRRRGSSRR